MRVLSVLVLFVLFAGVVFGQPLHEGKWLTRPERAPEVDRDSFHDYDVRHYRIDMNLPMNSGAMNARCRIELVARHADFDTFSLHFVNLVCDSVRREGNVCTFSTGSGRLKVTLDRAFAAGESLAVDVYYRRNSGTSNRGFFWYARGTQGIPHAVAYSVTQTDDSRYWFPCFDQPWDKAERGCRINVTVPDSFSVCANGALDSVSTGSGTKTYWWTHQFPISTYLMCFAASRFTDWQIWYRAGGDSMPIAYYVWPEDSSLAANNFSLMSNMIDFFSRPDVYGPYPFFEEKYGMVAVYPYPWGGMEHQTMTTIHRQWARNGSVNGIAHELAHMWWGDMVTCVDWRNIALNEGFATYSDELYEEHRAGRAAFLSMIRSRADAYFAEDQSGRRPLYDPPPGREFDWGHTYCKAAWVLHMLRYVVGDTSATRGAFFAAVRAFGDSFRFGTADLADLEHVVSGHTGMDLSWFFEEWVYLAGYPVYTVGWQGRQTNDSWEVVIDLAQSNGSGAPAFFRTPVELKITWSGGDTIVRYPITQNNQRNVIALPAQPTGVEFDPNEWILDRNTVRVGVSESPAAVGLPSLTLSSNPVRRGLITLNLNVPSAGYSVRVFDAVGRCVARRSVDAGAQTAALDLRALPAGVYQVSLGRGAETPRARLVLLD